MYWRVGLYLTCREIQEITEEHDMGWLFKAGYSRSDLTKELATGWDQQLPDGIKVTSTCLAHCYRGGVFSGVLWSVWERTFLKDGDAARPTQRWISCDLLQHQRDYGWGYKDLDELMGPHYYSCPLSYLEMVPLPQFAGNAGWRDEVRSHHSRQLEKSRAKRKLGST